MAVKERTTSEAAIVDPVLDYREYVQLVRTPEGWKIVNTLWAWT